MKTGKGKSNIRRTQKSQAGNGEAVKESRREEVGEGKEIQRGDEENNVQCPAG